MTRSALFELATAARAFLEPCWRQWHADGGYPQPEIASANTCARSSLFLMDALRCEGWAAEWQTGVPRFSETGPEQGPFGFRAGSRWESHSWVRSAEWIVDITADQFGAQPVIVTAQDDSRYGIGPVDPALPFHIAKRRRTIDQLWPCWLNYRGQMP